MKRLNDIVELIESKKGQNIEVISMNKSDYIFDYVIIATVLNTKHGLGLVDYMKSDLKPKGEEFLAVEGEDHWIVVDMGDILVHLMSEEYRGLYKMEEFLAELKENQDTITTK